MFKYDIIIYLLFLLFISGYIQATNIIFLNTVALQLYFEYKTISESALLPEQLMKQAGAELCQAHIKLSYIMMKCLCLST